MDFTEQEASDKVGEHVLLSELPVKRLDTRG